MVKRIVSLISIIMMLVLMGGMTALIVKQNNELKIYKETILKPGPSTNKAFSSREINDNVPLKINISNIALSDGDVLATNVNFIDIESSWAVNKNVNEYIRIGKVDDNFAEFFCLKPFATPIRTILKNETKNIMTYEIIDFQKTPIGATVDVVNNGSKVRLIDGDLFNMNTYFDSTVAFNNNCIYEFVITPIYAEEYTVSDPLSSRLDLSLSFSPDFIEVLPQLPDDKKYIYNLGHNISTPQPLCLGGYGESSISPSPQAVCGNGKVVLAHHFFSPWSQHVYGTPDSKYIEWMFNGTPIKDQLRLVGSGKSHLMLNVYFSYIEGSIVRERIIKTFPIKLIY